MIINQGLLWWSSDKESAFQCRDAGSIPGQGTTIPHATEQLSPGATTTELTCLNKRASVPQNIEPTHPEAHAPQLEREHPRATT